MMTHFQSDALDEEERFSGVPIVPGLAVGKAFFLDFEHRSIQELTLPQEAIEHEIRRYYDALQRSRSDIIALKQKVQKHDVASEILEAHLAITKDPIFTENVATLIRNNCKNAEHVLSSVVRDVTAVFTQNQALADRAADIQDVSTRIFGNLDCQHRVSLGSLEQKLIVFADLLMPSDIAGANPTYIRGLVSRTGAKTSHTAIVSQAKCIPYIANFPKNVWEQLQKYNGKPVLIRGAQGEIIFNPKPSTLRAYYRRELPVKTKTVGITLPTTTYVSAQAIGTEEFPHIRDLQVPVGLFRSEFLAITLQRQPSFLEQLEVYTQLATLSEQGSVLRLFDFNDDKPCFQDHHNSCDRSVRWLLRHPEVLKEQLQAIAVASAQGKIKVLIPGVVDASEILSVKRLMLEVCQGTIPEQISWGSMIEFPSAVWLIDELLVHCDFISIGTNDLTQYTLGRSREFGSYDDDSHSLHPSVIRMIYHVVRQAIKRNIPVSVCGEAAADSSLTPFFVGLGVRELSVAVPMIRTIQQRVASLDVNHCVNLVELLLKASCSQEVEALLTRKEGLSAT